MLMPEWLQSAVGQGSVEMTVILARLAAAFVLGCVAAGIYHFTMRARPREGGTTFPATLVLLCVLIAMVTLVIGDSVARAFSLVGALAIVRFRTVVEDTRDTAFVIFAVVLGMAAGTGFLTAPLVGTPLILLAAWLFAPRRAVVESEESTLVLRLGASRPSDQLLEEVLRKHLESYRLTGVGTARGGAAVDVTYAVGMPPGGVALTLLAELNRLEGVQGVEWKGR
jgi:uncharacterized membrane protein YhiD involved in acid resistance